jgi:hypothetical protein
MISVAGIEIQHCSAGQIIRPIVAVVGILFSFGTLVQRAKRRAERKARRRLNKE